MSSNAGRLTSPRVINDPGGSQTSNIFSLYTSRGNSSLGSDSGSGSFGLGNSQISSGGSDNAFSTDGLGGALSAGASFTVDGFQIGEVSALEAGGGQVGEQALQNDGGIGQQAMIMEEAFGSSNPSVLTDAALNHKAMPSAAIQIASFSTQLKQKSTLFHSEKSRLATAIGGVQS
ncbi:MAG: hypothetical protein HQL53_11280 [Magnetococcales bacterium]|nr:hypothetical protein [Magnetococcales bacterium]